MGAATSKTWLKRSLISLAALTALVASMPLFISLDDYIPRIEAELSARLNQPVTIESIKIAALPVPHATVNGITIGNADDIKPGKVTIRPDLWSLMQSTRVINSIRIDSLLLTRQGIDLVSALVHAAPAKSSDPPAVRITSIRLDNAVIRLDKVEIGPIDARVQLDGKGALAEASLVTQDGKLKVVVKPDQENYLFDLKATAWTLPAGPALVFDELLIKGVATQEDARLDTISAKLYGGTALGKMKLGWKKGFRFDGLFDISELELRQLAALLSPGTHLSGKLTAKPTFSSSAPAADQLAKALHLETAFNIRDGVLHGVDIQHAATHLLKQGSSGGETRFDHLSGHLVVHRGSQQFTQLRIASGALAADGRLGISPQKALSGRIHAQVKVAGIAAANVPLNVAGTVAEPRLYPTGATMAGAAAGTVLLGPGFGTSVGAKVGGWAEGLFDSKP
jgi:uncharacterized protein involved in outer membrane biogenesis